MLITTFPTEEVQSNSSNYSYKTTHVLLIVIERVVHFVEILHDAQTLLEIVNSRHDGKRALFESRTMRLQQQLVPRHIESFLG